MMTRSVQPRRAGKPARRAGGAWRRGAGIAVIVVMLAIINIAVIGSVAASGDESQVGAMRLETIRAFYAAESGAVVTVRLTMQGLELPPAGSELAMSNATVAFEQMPVTGEAGDAVIIGHSGIAQRRVKITLGEP